MNRINNRTFGVIATIASAVLFGCMPLFVKTILAGGGNTLSNHHSFLLPRIYHSWMHFIFEAKATGPEAFLCCPVYDRRLSVLQWQWERFHRISGPDPGFYIRDHLFFLCHISGCQWTTEHEYFQTYFLYASHGIPHDFCSSGSDGKSHISSQCKCLACHDFHVAFSVLYQCLRISDRSEIYRPCQHYDP